MIAPSFDFKYLTNYQTHVLTESEKDCYDGYFECEYSCCFEGKCGGSPLQCRDDFKESLIYISIVYVLFFVALAGYLVILMWLRDLPPVEEKKVEKPYSGVEGKSEISKHTQRTDRTNNDLVVSQIE